MADALALNVGVLLAIITAGASLMLLVVSLAAYVRLRQLKLLLPGGAFLVLAIQGAIWAWRGIVAREMDLLSVTLDAGVLVFLYASVAKR